MDGKKKNNRVRLIATIGGIFIAVILIAGTMWMGQEANQDNEKAVRSVSLLYLDELAGRREQVVENNLRRRIQDLRVAVDMMETDDLRDAEHLSNYQARIKQLYSLEKFAFVSKDGVIYTSVGTQDNIEEYDFDYRTISEPEISVFNLKEADKTVIIAVPVDLTMGRTELSVCFMEISMDEMLEGVSMDSDADDSTFCNIYTPDGIALSNTILGGLAVEDNLLGALENAVYEEGYTFDKVRDDFRKGNRGVVSFTYKGIRETLSYTPVKGTDWMLTYLIRESVISDSISGISRGIINRSIVQSVMTIIAMALMFGLIIAESRRGLKYQLEAEKAAAETRGKQEELDRSIALQNKLEEQSRVLSDALQSAEEANKAKTTFLANMSHEIRTPMNAIIGLDNIALSDPDTPPKTREYLEKIGVSADHLLILINDILDMSRIESGKMSLKNEEFSFLKLVESINTMFFGQCADKGLEYQCRIESEVDDYYIGDDMKLRQILINILGNAVKFTPEGGSVELSIRRLSRYEGKSVMRFTITDTGIGMSEEFIPHIFDSFAQEDNSNTNRYGSTGLGMAITKNMVEMMNGTIEVESEKHRGSKFTVVVTLGESSRRDAEDDSSEVHPDDMKVLIIDDDPVACEHAKLVLEKAGIVSEIVSSGQEALKLVELRHARMDPYNLILVDWKMPDMDGVETTRKIREITGDESAIIILTAYKWDDIFEEAVKAGVDSFISKPLFAATVIDEFSTAMRRRRSSMAADEGPVDLTGKRILVAEDVDINAEIIMMVLQSRGLETERASNGRIAADMYLEHPEGYYDAVLMDLRMPEMDGLEATGVIRGSGRSDSESIPVIALTANAFDEDVQRSLQAGLNAHLSKPVQEDALFATLQSLIGRK